MYSLSLKTSFHFKLCSCSYFPSISFLPSFFSYDVSTHQVTSCHASLMFLFKLTSLFKMWLCKSVTEVEPSSQSNFCCTFSANTPSDSFTYMIHAHTVSTHVLITTSALGQAICRADPGCWSILLGTRCLEVGPESGMSGLNISDTSN